MRKVLAIFLFMSIVCSLSIVNARDRVINFFQDRMDRETFFPGNFGEIFSGDFFQRGPRDIFSRRDGNLFNWPFFFDPPFFYAPSELEEVNAEIEKLPENERWGASQTEVSKLSESEQEELCGVKIYIDPPAPVNTPSPVEKPRISVEIRDQYPILNYLELPNQGSCGSCWDFASLLGAEITHAITFNEYKKFSREEVLRCCPLDDPNSNGCCGNLMALVYQYLEQTGLLEQADFPFLFDPNRSCETGIGNCLLINALREKFQVEYLGDYPPFETLAEHYSAGHPVIFVIKVHRCFFYYNGLGIYTPVLPQTIGYHALCSTGGGNFPYQHVHVANSWDKDWGLNGWGELKYGGPWIGIQAAAIVGVKG